MLKEIKLSSYQGIDKTKSRLISRFIRASQPKLRFGMGFIHKEGVTVDTKKYRCPYYVLIYVIRGKGEYIDFDGKRYKLSAGSIFQRHPNIEHSLFIDPESQWAECFIDFNSSLYDMLIKLQIIKKNEFVYKIPSDFTIESDCFDLLNRLEYDSEATFPFLIADIIAFLSKILRRCTIKSENEIDKIIDKVCIDFGKNLENRINIHQYCKNMGFGYENFRKLFREKTGLSPRKYIIRKRLDTACQMLLMLDKTINEIALILGYKSQYEFSAQFKKFIGISPKAYRLNC